MAFNLDNWDKLSGAANISVVNLWSYFSSTDNTATCIAANYFDNIAYALKIADQIFINASDGPTNVVITAVTPHVTVSAESGVAANSITNTQINSAAGISYSKLQALPSGDILVGSAGNVATPVAMSGDVGIIADGATTIQAGAVTSSKISADVIQHVTVSVTLSQFLGMYVTPIQIIAAQGANTVILLNKVIVTQTYGSAALANGGASSLQYGNTTEGAGVLCSQTATAATYFETASTNVIYTAATIGVLRASSDNVGIFLSNITGAFTAGTGSTFTVDAWYSVISN